MTQTPMVVKRQILLLAGIVVAIMVCLCTSLLEAGI
jgi:hypothetical protein